MCVLSLLYGHSSITESAECVRKIVLMEDMYYSHLLTNLHHAWCSYVCMCVCVYVLCRPVRFTLACACAVLFNYRSGFEAEANSAIITGNTSFNILWKSTLCVCVCV